MSTPSKPSLPNPVDIIAKLHNINTNHQDAFFNTLSFSLQACSLLIKSSTNVNNSTSIGLANLSQSINSSRFILRFLSGISSIHVLITNQGIIKQFFSAIKKKYLAGKTSSSSTDPNEPADQPIDFIPFLRLVQASLTLLFNVTEIPAYISTVAPTLSAHYDGGFFGRLSCVFWLLNTLVEILVLTILRFSKKELTSTQYQTSLIPLICDCFLSANWTMEPKHSFLSEAGLTTLGSISSWVNFLLIWKGLKNE